MVSGTIAFDESDARIRHPARVATGTMLFSLLVAVCDVSMGAEAKKVSTDELERQLHAALVEQGRPATSIDCPDDLDKEMGATVECTGVSLGLEQTMRVTFNGINGDLINVQVAEEPIRATPYGLTNLLASYLQELGQPADAVDCPDALDADKGSQVECAIVHDGLPYAVAVTSAGVEGDEVNVRYAVAEKPSVWPRDWLARKIQALVEKEKGTPPDSVDCPGDLDAGEGSKVECTFVENNGLEFTAMLTAKGASVDLRTADDPTRINPEGARGTRGAVAGRSGSPEPGQRGVPRGGADHQG